ncbi:MAG: hypothetical protein HW421_3168 [Ignavibacteria bacterium]|nr:hypothetical protein [Ignavibacteria bacterium]
MEKVQLIVLGLSASPASNNAYALILKELDGNRRLPIIIGAFEAQAIALEIEEVMPPRPMTHDLIRVMMESLGATLVEVYINELREGTFYAKLIFDSLSTEIDARPSDAIAIALRCNAPIFINSDILDETGLIPQEDDTWVDENLNRGKKGKATAQPNMQTVPKSRIEHLQTQLDKAINDEDYERAANLRDEIRKMSES